MRYYDITITPEGSSQPLCQWSSYPNGNYDPCALDIEFDMPILPYGTPAGGQTITIHGIPLADIGQAYQFASTDKQVMNLTVRAGMKAGFPLANPAQAGVILQGMVFQAFGNWCGTEMTLDLIEYPSAYTIENPGNIVLDWKEGQPLGDALKQTLSIAYPGMPLTVSISPDHKNSFHVPSYYPTLEGLAQFVGQFTEQVFKNRVEIVLQAGKILVYDQTHRPTPTQLAFNDFIGQPTWLKANVVQLQTVLRADLEVGSMVRMPQGLQNAPGFANSSASAALSQQGAAIPSTGKNRLAFQGDFQVIEMRHVGHFRSPDSNDWSTTFNCVSTGAASAMAA